MRWLLRLYPRAWRRRYGDEFLALIEERRWSPGVSASSAAPARPGGPPFDRFTPRSRNVLRLAQEEAERLQHTWIGTEHLLLGLLLERDGVAARVGRAWRRRRRGTDPWR